MTDEVTVADIVARKVIVFINSVSQIIKICKENKLAKDDVAIVVADSSQNDARISGYNRLTNASKLPKFTFITSSGFEGIDLYDDQAVSVVVSNTKKNHQMIDLLTDFKQATSRQRVKTNPNYGKFVFIYNQSAFDEEEGTLVKQLDYWHTMIQKSVDFSKKDKATYAFVSKDNQDLRAYTNIVNDEYVMNDNLFNADRYFILEVMKQYREGFDIRGAVEGYDVQDGETDVVDIPRDVTYNDIAKYAQEYISAKVKDFADSQRRPGNFVAYQSVEETPEMRKALFSMIDWGYLSTRREWIEVVGKTYVPLRKIWVTLTEANAAILALSNGTPDSLKALVHGKFNTGKCYTRAEVKKVLNAAYLTLNIKRVAKHTDLYEYFECKEKKVMGERQLDVIKRK
jgi:hypothetical protein